MSAGGEEAATLLRLAQQDKLAFTTLLANPDIELRIVCFHAQQAVEKFFKAVLVAQDSAFPPTHNLLKLGELIAETGEVVPVPADMLRRLNPYAVVFRYDDREIHTITREQARTLVESVSAWAIRLLDRSNR